MPSLLDLLHKTIREIHALHLFPITNSESDYETLLEHTLESILLLLNYHNKYYVTVDVEASSNNSDLSELSFLYYIDKDEETDVKDFNNSSIIHFIQSSYSKANSEDYDGQELSRSHVLTQLLSLLSQHDTVSDRKPVRLKDSYSLVLLKFSELVEFFAKFHSESEKKLVNYINKCFCYELDFVSGLRNRLDDELQLGEDETEKIVQILDSFISVPEPEFDADPDNSLYHGHSDNSIFSYEDNELESRQLLGNSPLKFNCTDPNFVWLYQIFLQISGYKADHSNHNGSKDYKEYIKLMLSCYKKHNSVDFLEINNFKFKELKLKFFYNFLVGNLDGSQQSLLPEYFKDATNRVINRLNVFPEIDKVNNYEVNRGVGISDLPVFGLNDRQSNPKEEHLPGVLHEIPQEEHVRPSSIRPLSGRTDGSVNNFEEQPSFISFVEYSRNDQLELFLSLRHIIPLLNEFNLNFDASFPLIFKHYMKLVYVDFSESTEQADFEYIERIVVLVNSITEFENTEVSDGELDIKDTVFSFYNEHQYLLTETDDENSHNPTLLMNLAKQEFSLYFSLKKNIFNKWNFKTLYIGQLDYNLEHKFNPVSNEFCQKSFLKKWFSKYRRFKDLQSVSSNYSEKRVKVNFIKDTWIPSVIKIGNMNDLATSLLMKKFFSKWSRKNQKISNLKADAVASYNKTALSLCFAIWVNKLNHIIQLSESALMTRKANIGTEGGILMHAVWSLWLQKFKTIDLGNPGIYLPSSNPKTAKNERSKSIQIPTNLSEKLIVLSAHQKFFILLKFMKLWRLSYSHSMISKEIKSHNDYNLMKYFFKSQWINHHEVNKKAQSILRGKELELKRRAFHGWKSCTDSRKIADTFAYSIATGKAFNQWKLNSQLSHLIKFGDGKTSNHHKLTVYFKKWNLKRKFNSFQKSREFNSVKQIYNVWKSKLIDVNEMKSISQNLSQIKCSLDMFALWKHQVRNQKNSLEVADLNFQRKFFNHMLALLHHYAVDYRSAADEFKRGGIAMSDKLTMASALRKWKIEYYRRFEILAQNKIVHFKKKVVNLNIKFTFFSHWVKKYNESHLRAVQLDQACNDYVQNSKKHSDLFHKWSKKTKRLQDLNQKSRDFEAYLLFKKIIVIWYNQFINKIVYLDEVADDFASKEDYNRAREFLSRWSMKYIKQIRRNHQTCEMFIQRWEVAKAKSIFELWLQKSKERSGILNAEDFEADMSFVSNLSPLANKSNRSFKDHNPNEDSQSYLYTPVKLQVLRSPSTPFLKSPKRGSPTKLEETNRRLKAERLESLKSRFSKARGQSTPTKRIRPLINSLADSKVLLHKPSTRMMRLSPPKSPEPNRSTFSPKALNLNKFQDRSVPPKAPNFNLTDTPQAFTRLQESIRPSIDYVTDDALNTDSTAFSSRGVSTILIDEDEDETSVIESAKRLNRITPIFIPPDSETEPRFSPVFKLKERLRSGPTHNDDANSFITK